MITLAVALAPHTAFGQLDDVFGGNSGQLQPMPPANGASSIDLSVLLRDGGFNLVDTPSADFCKIEVENEDYTFPVFVYTSDNKRLIWIKIGLDDVPLDAGDHVDKLLSLMAFSGSYGPNFYSFDPETRLISLYSSMWVENISKKKLTETINIMVFQATEQAPSWDTSLWTAARHVGSWAATMDDGGEITINLRPDGSFDLVNGATSITGNYTVADGTLDMTDTDNNNVSGAIVFLDGNHFNFTIGGQKLNFERR